MALTVIYTEALFFLYLPPGTNKKESPVLGTQWFHLKTRPGTLL